MKVTEKLKQLREQNQWSQEDMAEKMQIASSSYAKLERGETRITLDRLEQFAEIFNVDITKLIQSDGGFNYQISENHSTNYYNSDASQEIEKLQLIISHKDELLIQKDKEIAALQEVVALLKK